MEVVMVVLKRLILILLMLYPFTAEAMRAQVLDHCESVGLLLLSANPKIAYLLGKRAKKYANRIEFNCSSSRENMAVIVISAVDGFWVYGLGRYTFQKIFNLTKKIVENHIKKEHFSDKEKAAIKDMDDGFNMLVKWIMFPISVLSASQFFAGYFSKPDSSPCQSTTTYLSNFVDNIQIIKRLLG